MFSPYSWLLDWELCICYDPYDNFELVMNMKVHIHICTIHIYHMNMYIIMCFTISKYFKAQSEYN